MYFVQTIHLHKLIYPRIDSSSDLVQSRTAPPAGQTHTNSFVSIESNVVFTVLSHMTQTKLYDLESQVRRGVAERGAAEIKKNECQDEIQRQKEQMEHTESLCKRQLEGAQNMCTQEKVNTIPNECVKLSLLRAWKM